MAITFQINHMVQYIITGFFFSNKMSLCTLNKREFNTLLYNRIIIPIKFLSKIYQFAPEFVIKYFILNMHVMKRTTFYSQTNLLFD